MSPGSTFSYSFSCVQYLPAERYLLTTPQLVDRMCMTLGGRVSEEIFFGEITTGAQDDLQKITRMAFEICANYGMNSVIGPVSYGGKKGESEQFQKPFSEQTGQMLDNEVRKMITYVKNHSRGWLPSLHSCVLVMLIGAPPSCSPSTALMLRRSPSSCWRKR